VLVDLWFPVTGRTLPSDHGYALYGALARAVPKLHDADDWALHTLRGESIGPGMIALSRRPYLGLRLPPDRITLVLPLAGRTLDVRGHCLAVGSPTVMALEPTAALSARIVTIKSFMEPVLFAEAVRRQLAEVDNLKFQDAKVTVGVRKIVTIDGRRVVGFSVRIAGLSNEASLLLQEQGIGGRRKMGCGVFRKSERDLAVDVRPRREAAE
jgi:CRISPR-associated protein Cas6